MLRVPSIFLASHSLQLLADELKVQLLPDGLTLLGLEIPVLYFCNFAIIDLLDDFSSLFSTATLESLWGLIPSLLVLENSSELTEQS